MDIVIAPIYTIFYALVCLLLGVIIFKLLSLKRKIESQFPLYVLIVTGFLLGQGILANVWLLVGLASWLKTSLIWGILIVTSISGILLWPFSRSTIWLKIKENLSKIKKLTLIWKILLILVILLILIYALGAIVLPPTADAEALYMVWPKIIAGSEVLQPQPNYYLQSQLGLSGEMHYAVLMAIANPEAAQFFTWFSAIAVVILLLSICSLSGAKIKGRILALVILFTSTAFALYIIGGKVDLYSAAFGLAAYYWVLQTNRENNLLPLTLTGLFAGLAFVAKFSSAVAIIPGIILIILWNNYFKCRLKLFKWKDYLLSSFFSLLLVAGFFALSIIPHLIKNWALFNEPFAPFIFLKTQGVKWLDTPWFSKENTRYILLTYPIALIFGQYPVQGGNLSVFVLAFMPLLVFLKIKNFWQSKLFQVILLGLIGFAGWMIINPSIIAPRYILATSLLFIVPVAMATEQFMLRENFKILKIVIFLSIFFILSLTLFNNLIPFKYSLKKEEKAQFYSPYYNSLKFINQKAGIGERIYLAGYYSYYLRPDILQCFNGPDGKERISDPEIWENLFQRGFKYVIVQKESHKSVLKSLTDTNKPDWLNVQEIYDDPSTKIFSLESTDSNYRLQCDCQSKNQKFWQVICQN